MAGLPARSFIPHQITSTQLMKNVQLHADDGGKRGLHVSLSQIAQLSALPLFKKQMRIRSIGNGAFSRS
jgi:hypothetical protein